MQILLFVIFYVGNIFGWSSKGIEKCKYLTVMGRPDGSKVKFTADIFDISISLFDMSVSKTPQIPCSRFNNSFLCLLMLINCNAEPVPPGTNQYRLLLTQYHHVPNRTTLYWPSTIISITKKIFLSLNFHLLHKKLFSKYCLRIRISKTDLHCLLGLVYLQYYVARKWL